MSPILYRWWQCAVVVIAIIIRAPCGAAAKPQAAADLLAEYEQLSTEYAASAEGWRPARPATGNLIFVAADQYADAADDRHNVSDERRSRADALFELAKRAAEAGQLSLAIQWVTETVRENPDHTEARRILGYEKRDGQWLTPYALKMADAGKVWNSKLGWVVAEDSSASELKGRKDDWRVRTDHFLVSSNHSLEAAAKLGARLERLHQVWQQLFAGFYLGEREVKQLFAGERAARQRSQPFRVIYHRDRDDYVAELKRRQPRIAETLGIYFDTYREAHFFAGDDEDAGTLYHETVHQLFQESQPAARRVGGSANFWVVEGVATYFETLSEHHGTEAGLYYTIGEASAGRLPAARRRLADDNFYIQLDELTRWGKDELQREPELGRLYSQAAGLAAFLMDAEQARYRESLVRYLQAVYAGRDDANTLASETGHTSRELDSAYRRFMECLPP